MLDLVGLSTQADRYPHQLSGGQQQRVALARALAISRRSCCWTSRCPRWTPRSGPSCGTDPQIQLEVGITTLFVTHDQEEALAIADRVGVMREGRMEQLASPTEVYTRPATAFVADFVGLSNRLSGEVRGGEVIVRGRTLPLMQPDVPTAR